MRFLRWAFGRTWFDDSEDVVIFALLGLVTTIVGVVVLVALAALLLNAPIFFGIVLGLIAAGLALGRLFREAHSRTAHESYPHLAAAKWRENMGGTPPWEQAPESAKQEER